MIRKMMIGLAALVSGAALSAPSQAQDLKLYAFSSGALTIGKGALLNTASMTDIIQVPVGFYVIKHPKGNVLFDTGNNDKIISDPTYWGPFIKGLTPERGPDVAIDTQLKKIGLTPDDIKYVAVGHMHLDHGGNVCKFPKATLLVQRDEMKNAAWPEPGTAGPYIPGDVACLRSDLGTPLANKYKMEQLTGDLDVFGDGSVVIKSWAGHTPGSQMAIVRLPKTEAWLVDRPLTEVTLRQAGRLARDEIKPISDVRGSAEYRSILAENILLKFGRETLGQVTTTANGATH